MLRFFRAAYEKAYGTVDVVPEELAKLHDVFARYPALILPAHKANVDAPVVNTVLADHGLPLPSLFAGINMSFWPMGPIMRRAGYIFLRRDIRENATYRFVLREYLAYLIERRFNLSWFPEGTRSRTGKLLPPKLGLLTYVVDAYRQGRIEDIMLVPVSLAYDQVYETKDFAREAKGGYDVSGHSPAQSPIRRGATMATPVLVNEVHDGIRRLTLSRPERRNALNGELVEALAAPKETSVADQLADRRASKPKPSGATPRRRRSG
jgi:1-acyl-sn-glycerol-3-phosphate acyltransferase